MQMTPKEFRHLAQGTQSIVTSVAVIAVLAMAWYGYKRYRDSQPIPAEAGAED